MPIAGLDDLLDKLKQAQKDLPTAVGAALYQFAEEVMGDSKLVVPVDTGALMTTGKVMPPEFDGGMVEVTLGYGDESVGYALIVHEEMSSPSGNPIKWTRPGSGPHYLIDPLEAKQAELPARVKQAVMDVFTK